MNLTVSQRCKNNESGHLERKIITALATLTPTLSVYRHASVSKEDLSR